VSFYPFCTRAEYWHLLNQILIYGGDNMEIVEIFEKVNLVTPIEQRRFFNYFEDTVNELQSLYSDFGDFVFVKGKEYTPPKKLSDANVVLPLYHNAIVDNILFFATNEENYKGEFIRKSDDAYKKYWNDNAKGRRKRRMRW
jgi:hypothetical protein